VFTARYALSPYIKQIRFVFKGLIGKCRKGNKRVSTITAVCVHYRIVGALQLGVEVVKLQICGWSLTSTSTPTSALLFRHCDCEAGSGVYLRCRRTVICKRQEMPVDWDFRRVRKMAKSDYWLRRMSICQSAWNNSAPAGRIFMKFDIRVFFEDLSTINISLKSEKNNGTLHEDLCTFMIISRWTLLRMRNVSHKSCRENQNTHFMFNYFFPKIVPFMR
jgi:hypothetical protein